MPVATTAIIGGSQAILPHILHDLGHVHGGSPGGEAIQRVGNHPKCVRHADLVSCKLPTLFEVCWCDGIPPNQVMHGYFTRVPVFGWLVLDAKEVGQVALCCEPLFTQCVVHTWQGKSAVWIGRNGI